MTLRKTENWKVPSPYWIPYSYHWAWAGKGLKQGRFWPHTYALKQTEWTLSQARTCLHGPMATPTPIKFKYERAQHGTCTWNELQETLGWINGWVNSSNPTENKNTVLGHRASLWRSSLYPPARLRSPASPSLHLPTLPAALPALVASCPAPDPSASQHLWVQTPPRGPTARSHEWHATVQAAWGWQWQQH